MPVITPTGGGGGGGSTPSVTTGTLSTDANTYLGSVVIDLLVPSIVDVAFTATVLTPGGATFGTGVGDVGGSFGVTASHDGIAYVGLGGALTFNNNDVNGLLSSVGQTEEALGIAWRFIKISTQLFDDATFNPYAGPDHPVMTGAYVVTATALG